MTGVIVLNKPQNFTSFDAVAVVRRLTRERKIGHTGTLDPMATGVLPLLLGKATKAASLLPNTGKVYEAGFKLGVKTDTGDCWGEEKQTSDVQISLDEISAILPNFTGDIFQIPPMYSAVSVKGQRLYTLARQGIEIEREERPAEIYELTLLSYNSESREGQLKVSCGKGTYIRTLIEDIAEAIGTVGTMTSLKRTFACGFDISEAITLDELKELENNCESALRPVEQLFENMPTAFITPPQEIRFLNGGALDLNRLKLPKIALPQNTHIKVAGEDFVGIGAILGEQLRPVKHFK